MSSIKRKYNKLKVAKQNDMLIPLLQGRLVKLEHDIKIRFMKKGTTQYVKDIIDEEVGFKFLKKEYNWYLKNQQRNYECNGTLPKVIWWCWFQGIDQAPEMVKMCLDSIVKNFKGYKLNVITLDNVQKFVNIPEYIMKKFKSGIISYAHFSDIIRILLLAQYGGVWIDATVYCSNSNILSVIENTDFFIYQNGLLGNDPNIKISNWFISSKKNEVFVNEMKKLLLHYWKTHNYVEDYFIFHLLFTLVTKKYPKEWDKVPAYNNVSPHMMVKELNSPYSQVRYQQLNSFSSMHKLDHHIKYNDNADTLYHHLLKNSTFDITRDLL